MKTKHYLLLYGVVAVLAVTYMVSIVPNFRHQAERKRAVRALRSSSIHRVLWAVQTLAQDRRATNGIVPLTVSLSDLVSAGYLQRRRAEGFEGVPLVFYTDADETSPGMILAEARLSDGIAVVLCGDGSIMQLSPWRYRDQMEQQRRDISQSGSTNENQPTRSETNQPSPVVPINRDR